MIDINHKLLQTAFNFQLSNIYNQRRTCGPESRGWGGNLLEWNRMCGTSYCRESEGGTMIRRGMVSQLTSH